MKVCISTVAVSSLVQLMRSTFVPSAPAETRSLGVVPSAATNVTSAHLAVLTKIGDVLAAITDPP